MSEEKILKAIVSIADSFESLGNLAAELKALVGEITETGTVTHITDKTGGLLARVFKSDRGEITILPVESLEIKAADPAVERFFVPRVLEKLREKHGANYKIETSQNLLKTIKITGLNPEQLNELKSPLAWTLEKASERKKTPASQPTS